jgi:hypothetical protein
VTVAGPSAVVLIVFHAKFATAAKTRAKKCRAKTRITTSELSIIQQSGANFHSSRFRLTKHLKTFMNILKPLNSEREAIALSLREKKTNLLWDLREVLERHDASIEFSEGVTYLLFKAWPEDVQHIAREHSGHCFDKDSINLPKGV